MNMLTICNTFCSGEMEETVQGRNLAGELLRVVPQSSLYSHALLPHKRNVMDFESSLYKSML